MSTLCRKCRGDLALTGAYKGQVCKTCRKAATTLRRQTYRSRGLCGCGKPRTQGQQCFDCKAKARKAYVDDDVKSDVFRAYGAACVCCGETRLEFLSIDHIIPVGSTGPKHLRSGHGLYKWLRTRNYPKDAFRLLCMNCNFARGQFGYCPHERELGFAYFSAGKKQHIYIQMDHKLKATMEKVTEYCKLTKTDINEVIQPVAEGLVRKLEELGSSSFE